MRDDEVRRASCCEVAEAALGWGASVRRRRRLGAPGAEGQPGALPPPCALRAARRFPMTSTSESSTQSPVETAAVVAHGRVDVGERRRAGARGGRERRASSSSTSPERAQLAVAVGGDGTILRTLAQLLGTGVPVIGVNFGRVGFLASIAPERLEDDLARVFAGEYRIIELPTLEVQLDGERFVAVNDVVATSSTLGRMVELGWTIAGEDLGVVPCDGMICSTPSGSTAYNLSNGGPVLVRGLDAMAITFIAPHSLDARPLVVPRGAELTVRNATPDVGAACSSTATTAVRSRPTGRSRSGSASSAACSRRCRRRRSSAATARRSRPKERMGGVGPRSTIACVLRRLRIENLVLIREAELELAPGLNAITGETGAGKTILAQALGLLLGAKGDDSFVGAAGERGLRRGGARSSRRSSRSSAELRPEDEDALVVSRRVFADGRTRAYAWGRAAAREDVAAAVERVVAMSGQFEQRRLARPSYQLEVLDRFCGEEQLARRAAARTAWRELQAARRRHDELTANAALAEARLAELRALVEDTEGMEPGEEDAAADGARAAPARRRARRRRGRGRRSAHARRRRGSRRPRRARRARGRTARAARARAAAGRRRAARRRAAPARDGLRSPRLPRLARSGAGPARGDRGRARPDRRDEAALPLARPTTSCSRGATRRAPSSRRSKTGPIRPSSPPRELAEVEARIQALALELRAERNAAAPAFADAVAAELRGRRHGRGRVRLRAAGA